MVITNWKLRHTFGTVFFCLFLSACGNESAAKKATLAALKDPGSAKFGSFSVEGERACLTVNARNALGGYTGDHEVFLEKNNGVWEVSEITDTDHENCKRAMKNANSFEKSRAALCKSLIKRMKDNELDRKLNELYVLSGCSN